MVQLFWSTLWSTYYSLKWALDFRWGAQTYWRCWEWWRWSSVSRRVSQLMWLVHLVRMHSGCLPRGHFQPSRRLQGRPSTYRRDYIPHICQDYTLCPRGGAGLGTRSVKWLPLNPDAGWVDEEEMMLANHQDILYTLMMLVSSFFFFLKPCILSLPVSLNIVFVAQRQCPWMSNWFFWNICEGEMDGWKDGWISGWMDGLWVKDIP